MSRSDPKEILIILMGSLGDVVRGLTVADGVKSGELTQGETARLEKGEQKIEADRQAALTDGKMTRKEKVKLNHEENKQSKKIRKLKHNGRKA